MADCLPAPFCLRWRLRLRFFPQLLCLRFQVGPYANPAVAARVYEKVPVGDFLECSITAAFLVTAKLLSLVGFKDFTPNHF